MNIIFDDSSVSIGFSDKILEIKYNDSVDIVISDIHYGLERSYFKELVKIYKPEKILHKIVQIVNEKKPKRVILLGDIKQTVYSSKKHEMKNLIDFFDKINGLSEIYIAKGNHDGAIEKWLPKYVKLFPASGGVIRIGKLFFGFLHGHAYPSVELFNADVIISGHIHPVVEITDDQGARFREKIWLFSYEHGKKSKPKLRVISPAYNELLDSGFTVDMFQGEITVRKELDAPKPEKRIFNVHLTDGTILGEIDLTTSLIDSV
ncbi:MAG: metallophosphoesterase family protein [Candidatus Heimdallarchaeota archaeon]|nr:metallophosphoesterase family protein [Candidatus Heimdallarchaeota archaeon]MCK5047806.1 metallophosphoesterase family protein [Candidatus Heimdallarchaeota archaeon]